MSIEKLIIRNVEIIGATSSRVGKAEKIEGFFYYDIRHDDDCLGIPCTLEPFVFVNHWGTIVTNQQLALNTEGCLELDEHEQEIVNSALATLNIRELTA